MLPILLWPIVFFILVAMSEFINNALKERSTEPIPVASACAHCGTLKEVLKKELLSELTPVLNDLVAQNACKSVVPQVPPVHSHWRSQGVFFGAQPSQK